MTLGEEGAQYYLLEAQLLSLIFIHQILSVQGAASPNIILSCAHTRKVNL